MRKNISLSLLLNNEGQIEGLPSNPRTIHKKDYSKLVKSLIEDPEMLFYKDLLIYPYGTKYIVIAGNMRLMASNYIATLPQDDFDDIVKSHEDDENFSEWLASILLLRDKKEAPCYVLDRNTPASKLRSFSIKDNSHYGHWDEDMLSNEWEQTDLADWGVQSAQMSLDGLNLQQDQDSVDEYKQEMEKSKNDDSQHVALTIYFDPDMYRTVVEALNIIGEEMGTESTAEIIQNLIENYQDNNDEAKK